MTDDQGWASWPGLGLAVAPTASLAGHLRREYGPPARDARAPVLRLLARPPDPTRGAWTIRGGHKGTRWAAVVGAPTSPVEAWLDVRGPFGAALVQSQVLEPLLAAGMALAEGGRALVPGAAFVHDGLVDLVVGDSGAGKTSVAMRAVGAGWELLGDDRILVSPAGLEAFPRRHRVYPDVTRTAPRFWARLSSHDRRAVRLRGVLSRLSRGFIRLPALVSPLVPPPVGIHPVGRATLLLRGDAPDGWLGRTDDLLDRLGRVIDRDRRWIAELGGPWPGALAAARSRELDAVRAAIGTSPVRLAHSPDAEAGIAVARVAEAFGIDP